MVMVVAVVGRRSVSGSGSGSGIVGRRGSGVGSNAMLRLLAAVVVILCMIASCALITAVFAMIASMVIALAKLWVTTCSVHALTQRLMAALLGQRADVNDGITRGESRFHLAAGTPVLHMCACRLVRNRGSFRLGIGAVMSPLLGVEFMEQPPVARLESRQDNALL